MKKYKKRKPRAKSTKPSQREVEDALAAVIASTKRKRRRLNPLQVAQKIEIAKDGLKGLSNVAERTQISPEMLRQILSVEKCSSKVKKLVSEGKLRSYDILHRLTKLRPPEQIPVAKAVVAGDLSSDDVRAIVSLRKQTPSVSINRIIDRIKRSRNIRHYVAYFLVPSRQFSPEKLRSRFDESFGKGNIISFKVDKHLGELVLSVEGKRRLQKSAKESGVTKRRFLENVVSEV